MKLFELNERYPLTTERSSLVMRETVRTMCRKTIRESREPLTGAYWWCPKPTNTGVEWRLVEFYDNAYNDNTGHMDMWPEVCEMIALWWNKNPQLLKRQLDMNYSALPRGRVNGVVMDNQQRGWTICHGDDAPSKIDGVLRAFNLMAVYKADRVKILFDEHEQMLAVDCKRIQNVLKFNLGLKGIEPNFD